jgi:hypothetical protein
MIAFWWEDWPGSRLRPGWSGLADTLLVAAAAIAMTVVGQLVVGRVDLRGIFDPTPGPGHAPVFPATMALAASGFAAMLQLTLVNEGWPLRRLPPLPAGAGALAVSWAVAIALYLLLVDFDAPAGSGLRDRSGPLEGAELGAWLVVIGVWQVAFYVALRGWPFAEIHERWVRLASGNAAVLGAGVLTYLALQDLAGWGHTTITAVGGSVIAGGLLAGMQFEGWADARLGPGAARAATLAGMAVVSAVLYALVTAYADGVEWTRVEAEEWVAYAGLNAIGFAVVMHVAIGRRWPFAPDDPAGS